MRLTKRWFALIFALLLAGMVSSAAKARAEKSPAENSTFDVQTPDQPVSVSSLTNLPFEPERDSELPDDPGTQQQTQTASGAPPPEGSAGSNQDDTLAQGRQTKRILFLIPNFRAVSADQHLPPQTVKEKFKTAMLDSFDYSSFIFVAGQAGVAQANKSYPEFRQGAAGYGRYYWHTLADAINENTWVEFLIPTPLHLDTRYYTMGRGNFAKRLGYAFSRVAITRTDSGKDTFNFSEFMGAAAFSGVANLYYPSQERTFTKTYQRYIENLAIDSCVFAFKEVWPDINNAIFHQKD
ncbi:MAG: hypothetical protein WA510_22550 [Acidobacteriaceae bacterium]